MAQVYILSEDDFDDEVYVLTEMEQREAGYAAKSDFATECVLRLDAADLARRSPSFAHFQRQVSRWQARPPDGDGS